MGLSKEALGEFKALYLKTRGVELTDEEADKMGWDLLRLANLALTPINRE